MDKNQLYTQEEVLNAVRTELIESFGSLSGHNEMPYTVLGILQTAFKKIHQKQDFSFVRVNLTDELCGDPEGRKCFKNETIMSFGEDKGNEAFRKWWDTEGTAKFTNFCKSNKEYESLVDEYEEIKCFKCGRSCHGMPFDECITCYQKGLM